MTDMIRCHLFVVKSFVSSLSRRVTLHYAVMNVCCMQYRLVYVMMLRYIMQIAGLE